MTNIFCDTWPYFFNVCSSITCFSWHIHGSYQQTVAELGLLLFVRLEHIFQCCASGSHEPASHSLESEKPASYCILNNTCNENFNVIFEVLVEVTINL